MSHIAWSASGDSVRIIGEYTITVALNRTYMSGIVYVAIEFC